MPELPEVETLRRRLSETLPGKQILSAAVHKPKSFVGDVALLNQDRPTITAIERKSKILRFKLSNSLNLLTHLKMTGQLILIDPSLEYRIGGGHPTADWIHQLPSSHTRITFELSDDAKLFFNDQRLFGWIKLVTDEQVAQEWAPLALDVIDDSITPEYLYPLLQRRGIPIKVAIMDNALMSGVGNIYACDALNLAKISPLRPAKSLSFSELETLLAAIKKVIFQGIELGGTTTDGKYVDIHGMAGGYQAVMRVYDRAGQPCFHCGSPILKTKIAGRGTYYCGNCQI